MQCLHCPFLHSQQVVPLHLSRPPNCLLLTTQHTISSHTTCTPGTYPPLLAVLCVLLKGEIHELKEELRSLDRPKKKEAVKKVIAAMTVGKDVSMLFPDVVNCMQTEDLELKKLVYLYLINYAKTQPDLAIMAVNTFVKVCATPHSCCCQAPAFLGSLVCACISLRQVGG